MLLWWFYVGCWGKAEVGIISKQASASVIIADISPQGIDRLVTLNVVY
jgi:hypothetical protein